MPGNGFELPPGPIATIDDTRGSDSGTASTVQPPKLCPASPILSSSTSIACPPSAVASSPPPASTKSSRKRTSGTRLAMMASTLACRCSAVSSWPGARSAATTSEWSIAATT